MPMFRPTPAMLHLSNYWNALNRNAPAEELARLAALVDPADIATIERAMALHAWRMPDPAFAIRLEQTIMNAFPTTVQATVPLVTTSPPASNGRFAPRATEPDSRHRPQSRRWGFSSMLTVALVVLLVIASLGGIWLFNQRNNDTHILAPPDATPTTEASPDVPMYRGNPGRTGVMEGPGPLGSPVELWMTEVGGVINSSPAVVNGIAYFGAGDGGVYALDIATGAEVWRAAGDSAITASPAVVNGMVYVGSDSGTLYALHASDGSEAWTFPGTRSNASVVVDAGTVYTGSGDGFLYAIDAASGSEIWRAPLTESASRSPSVADGLVYIGSTDGVLHAIDSATGEERWTFQIETDSTISTTAITNGIVYQSTFDGSTNVFYAIDAATGEELWRYEQEGNPGFLPPAVGNGLVFIPSLGGSLHTLNATTGEEAWTFATGARINAAPALVGDTVYLAGNDGFIYSLDAATGEELWRYAIEGEVDFGPAVSNGVIYVGTGFGFFYAIGGSHSIPAMSDSTPTQPALSLASPPVGSATPVAEAPVTFLWETTGGDQAFNQPSSITLAPDGNIWITDAGHSRFQIFAPDGTYIESWGEQGSGNGQFDFLTAGGEGWGGVAFAPDGTFYVADAGNLRVQHFDANRQFLHAWGGFGSADGQFRRPIGIAVDSQGNVFVNDDNRDDVQKFDPDGAFLLKFGGSGSDPGQLNFQGNMTIDHDDNVWVADGENDRFQVWDNDGGFIAEFGGPGLPQEPFDIATDAQGRMYVTDVASRSLFLLDADGNVLTTWKAIGNTPSDPFEPFNLLLDGQGGLYVIDFWGNRLIKYELNPAIVAPDIATPVATPVS